MQNVGAGVYRYVHRCIHDHPAVGVIVVLDLDLGKDSRYGGGSQNGFGPSSSVRSLFQTLLTHGVLQLVAADLQHLVRLANVLEMIDFSISRRSGFIRNESRWDSINFSMRVSISSLVRKNTVLVGNKSRAKKEGPSSCNESANGCLREHWG